MLRWGLGASVYLRSNVVSVFLGVLTGFATALLPVIGLAEERPPIEAFGRLPELTGVKVSPDGSKVAALTEYNGGYAIVVYDISGPQAEVSGAVQDEESKANWVEWVRNDRLVASLRFPDYRFGVPTLERRLVGFSPEIKQLRNLVDARGRSLRVQIADRVVDWLPDDPKYILVQFNRDAVDEPQVHRVNVDTGGSRLVQAWRKGVRYWLTDAEHRVRLGDGRDEYERRVLTIRDHESGKWEDLSDWIREFEPTFDPVAFDVDPHKLLVRSDIGRGAIGLWRFDIATREFEELLFGDPVFDVSGVRLDKRTGALLGVRLSDDQSIIHWIDDEMQRLHAQLEGALAGQIVTVADRTPDGAFAVVHSESVTKPGAYYLFDPSEPALDLIDRQYPELSGYTAAPMHSVTFRARDGLQIPAFVTLPAGVESLDAADKTPFVVYPHGGPAARTFKRFDYITQFLASRGYGVLQLNYRGSTGYGPAFRQAGMDEWGEAMQDDIADGAEWLVEQGWADGDRLAILGVDYGGYAALMGGVRTPELYQCLASINGFTDLSMLVRNSRDFLYWKSDVASMGLDWQDADQLSNNSPVNLAKEMGAPVLLVHGEDNRTVPVAHSRDMARALRRSGKDVTYVELREGDHNIGDGANRVTFLREVEAFLNGCLGPA